MSENKYCGNCKHFVDKEVGGYGLCDDPNMIYGTHRSNKACSLHETMSSNGWTEITPDNVEELYDKPIAVAWKYEGKTYYSLAGDCTISLSTMAKYGGYYYYVLPELKIE